MTVEVYVTKNYTSKLLFRVLHADVILHALSYTNTKLLKELECLRISQLALLSIR